MRNHSVIPLFLLLSFSAFAQESIPDASLSVRQQFVSVDLDQPAFLAQPEVHLRQWQPYDPLTMGLQTLLGTAGGFVGAYAGFYGGINAGGKTWDGLRLGFFGGYVFSTMVGAPLGVYLAGESMGGNGSFWGTMCGGAVGSLIGVAALAVDGGNDVELPIVIVAALASPIIAYHLSASPDSTETDEMRSELTRPPVHPVVTWPVDPVTPRPDFEMTLLSLPL